MLQNYNNPNAKVLTVLLSSNTYWSLLNFRKRLIEQLINEGHRVIVVCPKDQYRDKLRSMGCDVLDIQIANESTNPIVDVLTIIQFIKVFWKTKPDICLLFTIKPVLYGAIASAITRVPIICTMTGLGTAFISGGKLEYVVRGLFFLMRGIPRKIFFQNPDDMKLLSNKRLESEGKVTLIPGSGVDLSYFTFTPAKDNQKLVFLLLARMLWDKGIGEYVDAAKEIRSLYKNVKFQLLGEVNVANRTSIDSELLSRWHSEGTIAYLGKVDDVRPYINSCDCVVLPSYREGLPRSLLEACAIGRPLIATDVPGCREVVDEGLNGFLCKPKDATDLRAKIEMFINLSLAQRLDMGLYSREKVERKFSEENVREIYLREIFDNVD